MTGQRTGGANPPIFQHSQQANVWALWQDLLECREQVAALVGLLAERGVVREVDVQARAHRTRFEQVRARQGPSKTPAHLEHVMGKSGVAQLIGDMAGAASMHATSCVGRAGGGIARQLFGAMAVPKILVVGDLTARVEVFDVTTKSLSRAPPMPSLKGGGGASVAWLGQVFVIGTDESHRYDPAAGVWQSLPPLGLAREGHAVAPDGGVLRVLGGLGTARCHKRTVLASTETLRHTGDSGGWKWQSGPRMPAARGWASFGVLGGCLYVAGGYGHGSGGVGIRSAARLALGSGEWVDLPPLPSARWGSLSAVQGGCFFVIGGFENARHLASVDRLDPARGGARGTWESLAPMENPGGGSDGAAVAVAGTVFVFGGNGGDYNGGTGTWEKYDVASNTWSAAARPSQSRRIAQAVAFLA